jgi:hypothetical protein
MRLLGGVYMQNAMVVAMRCSVVRGSRAYDVGVVDFEEPRCRISTGDPAFSSDRSKYHSFLSSLR